MVESSINFRLVLMRYLTFLSVFVFCACSNDRSKGRDLIAQVGEKTLTTKNIGSVLSSPTSEKKRASSVVQEWVDEEYEDWVLVLNHNPRLSFAVANSPINFFHEDFYPPSRIYSQDRVGGGGWQQLLFQYIH